MSMNSNPILILIVRPRGYVHSEAFRESAELLHFFLASNSFTAEIQEVAPGDIKKLDILRPKIIFGAHLDSEIIPSSTHVIVNLEQLSRPSTSGSYLDLLKRSWILDYSNSHVEGLLASNKNGCLGFLGLTGFQLAGSSSVTSARTEELLFFGSMTRRREAAIQQLRKQGLPVRIISGIYGPELWPWLSRCKAVLNIHAYDSCTPFESVRLSSLLTNGIPIISEKSIMNPWDQWLIDSGLQFFSMDDCSADLISTLQQCAEASAYEIAKESLKHNSCSRMSRLLEWCGMHAAKEEGTSPIRPWGLKIEGLHVGCGYKAMPTMINLDINECLEPDIVCDICDPAIVNMQYLDRARNQIVSLDCNSLTTIISDCTFEHLQDLPAAMKNCRDLLVPGGMLYLKVPYDLAFGAWQDPTHKQPFNEKSFRYYYEWAWYLGWEEWGLKTLTIRPKLTEHGINLRDQGKSLDDIARSPRAIDSLEVLLAKRLLSSVSDKLLEVRNEDKSQKKLLDNFNRTSVYKPMHAIQTLVYDSSSSERAQPEWLSRLKPYRKVSDSRRSDLPTITVVTPTTEKRIVFLVNCALQILRQDYPLELVEWLIIPDSLSTDLSRLVSCLDGILSVRVETSLSSNTIGKKRNIGLQKSSGEVIVHFDDDDYYFPNRILSALEALKSSADSYCYAGCNELPIYYLSTDDLWLSTPPANHACAGSFAYSKDLRSITFYDESVSNGEEFSFTRNYTLPLSKIDSLDCMICLAHTANTFDKNALRRSGESFWIKQTSLDSSSDIPYLEADPCFQRLLSIARNQLDFNEALEQLLSEVQLRKSMLGLSRLMPGIARFLSR